MDDDNIEGVLELASLKEMDEHQIAFVKQVAESIASSLRSGKINLKTRQLLDETRQKAESGINRYGVPCICAAVMINV